MTSYLFYNYYYRYREKRKQAKNLVDSTQYIDARTRLENDIIEHESFYPNNKPDFNHNEKLLMIHAVNHLNPTINKNDPIFFDENGNTRHQSDIVKEALLQSPTED